MHGTLDHMLIPIPCSKLHLSAESTFGSTDTAGRRLRRSKTRSDPRSCAWLVVERSHTHTHTRNDTAHALAGARDQQTHGAPVPAGQSINALRCCAVVQSWCPTQPCKRTRCARLRC